MSADSISVVCRLRPFNQVEIKNQGRQCVTFLDNSLSIVLAEARATQRHDFAFDHVFPPEAEQGEVFARVGRPILDAVFKGFNGTVMAYGQTGGGKTWTMEGPNHSDEKFKGLIPRTMEALFALIRSEGEGMEFVLRCSYMEIYNEKIIDLLDSTKVRLELKEDKARGVFVQGLTEVSVASFLEVMRLMQVGASNRKVAFTGMNEKSSRSHSLFTVVVESRDLRLSKCKTSKLSFVDLAGSEKVGKTGVTGQQLDQAKNINKSLTVLGMVINALTADKTEHIPYRDSKLTRVLQDSLGGNSKTTLVINCSICSFNDRETLSTLRFGLRAKRIKNKPIVNEERSVKELMLLLEEAKLTIHKQKLLLEGRGVEEKLEVSQVSETRGEEVLQLQEQLRVTNALLWEKTEQLANQRSMNQSSQKRQRWLMQQKDFCLSNLRARLGGISGEQYCQLVEGMLADIDAALAGQDYSLEAKELTALSETMPLLREFKEESKEEGKEECSEKQFDKLLDLLHDDKDEFSKLKADLAYAEEGRLESEARVKQLQEQCERLEAEFRSARDTVAKFKALNQQLHITLTQKEAEHAQREQEWRQTVSRLSGGVDADWQLKVSRVRQMEEELDELKEDLLEKEQYIKSLRGQFAAMEELHRPKSQLCGRCRQGLSLDYEAKVHQGEANIAKKIVGGKSQPQSLLDRLYNLRLF